MFSRVIEDKVKMFQNLDFFLHQLLKEMRRCFMKMNSMRLSKMSLVVQLANS